MNSVAACLTSRGMGSVRLYFARDSPCDYNKQTCLPLRLYHTCSGKSSKSIGHSGNTDIISKVPDSVINEMTTNKHSLSSFPQEKLKLLCRNLPKQLSDALRMRER